MRAAAASAFDVVLLDLQMPVMDENSRRHAAVRRLPVHSGGHIFIAALTAQAQDGVRDQTEAAGMDGFLSQAISLDRLNALLVEAEARAHDAAAPPVSSGSDVEGDHPAAGR